jgi:hypothetical protein
MPGGSLTQSDGPREIFAARVEVRGRLPMPFYAEAHA